MFVLLYPIKICPLNILCQRKHQKDTNHQKVTMFVLNQPLYFCLFQESETQKTNNGIQYRLQLLYANGKSSLIKFYLFLVIYRYII